MSCGLATIDYRHVNNIEERVSELSDISTVKRIGKENRQYILEYHEASKVANRLSEIWKNLA
jgi:hypothetical protein